MLEYDTVKLKGTAVQLRAFSTLWSTQDGAVFLLLPNELLEITGCPPRPRPPPPPPSAPVTILSYALTKRSARVAYA